jgi:hypothetical protein
MTYSYELDPNGSSAYDLLLNKAPIAGEMTEATARDIEFKLNLHQHIVDKLRTNHLALKAAHAQIESLEHQIEKLETRGSKSVNWFVVCAPQDEKRYYKFADGFYGWDASIHSDEQIIAEEELPYVPCPEFVNILVASGAKPSLATARIAVTNFLQL